MHGQVLVHQNMATASTPAPIRYSAADVEPGIRRRGHGRVRYAEVSAKSVSCNTRRSSSQAWRTWISSAHVAYGQPERIAAPQFGVREIHSAGGIDTIQNRGVEAVQCVRVVQARRMGSEANGAERRGRQAFEVRIGIDPGREPLCQIDMSAQDRRGPRDRSSGSPSRLECPEAPASCTPQSM